MQRKSGGPLRMCKYKGTEGELHTLAIRLHPLRLDPLHIAAVTIPLPVPVALPLTIQDATLPVSVPLPFSLSLAVEGISVSAASSRAGANSKANRACVRCQN